MICINAAKKKPSANGAAPHQPLIGIAYLFLFFLIIVNSQSYGQRSESHKLDSNQAFLNKVHAHAKDYFASAATEKVYIHFDRSIYLLGDDCWFKAYVLNGTDLLPSEFSGVLYVDWFDPNGDLIKHQKLRISNGEAHGDYRFMPDSPPGTYVVKAYTNWMRNQGPDFFFTKALTVFNTSVSDVDMVAKRTSAVDLDLQFFPEGGIVVNGLQTQIAFKGIDSHGRGVDVQGQIVDEEQQVVRVINSVHNGMGTFAHVPSPRKSYQLILNTGQVFDIPKGIESGVVLNASNISAEKIVVQIQVTDDLLMSKFYLIGQSGMQICYSGAFVMTGPETVIVIPKNKIPAGVLQLTLFDSTGIPRCERMVFVDNARKFEIQIESNKTVLDPRDSISLSIHARAEDGQPVQASLSIAITDADFMLDESTNENIYTNLLLQSDLKGFIEDPGWYFESGDRERIYALDLVMLTNGWRKFDWAEVLRDSISPVKHQIDQALLLKGQVVTISNKKPIPGARVTLIANGPDYNGLYVAESDADGLFMIENIDFSDSTALVWRIHDDKGRQLKADIVLLHDTTARDADLVRHNIPPAKEHELLEHHVAKFRETGEWNLENFRLLQEVQVEAARISNAVQIGLNKTLVRPGKDDFQVVASQFISRYAVALPFVYLRTYRDGRSAWVTPSGGRVIVSIDGHQAEGGGNPYFALNSLTTDQIDHVVISGSARSGYAIAVKTRRNSAGELNTSMVKQFAAGYYWPRKFYQPKYGPKDISTSLRDHRPTLFWDPYVVTDNRGNAVVKFYNSDIAKRLLVVAEGISNGVIGSERKIFGK